MAREGFKPMRLSARMGERKGSSTMVVLGGSVAGDRALDDAVTMIPVANHNESFDNDIASSRQQVRSLDATNRCVQGRPNRPARTVCLEGNKPESVFATLPLTTGTDLHGLVDRAPTKCLKFAPPLDGAPGGIQTYEFPEVFTGAPGIA